MKWLRQVSELKTKLTTRFGGTIKTLPTIKATKHQ